MANDAQYDRTGLARKQNKCNTRSKDRSGFAVKKGEWESLKLTLMGDERRFGD